jgi:hypothetical protein
MPVHICSLRENLQCIAIIVHFTDLDSVLCAVTTWWDIIVGEEMPPSNFMYEGEATSLFQLL